jgi:hypothetical protein
MKYKKRTTDKEHKLKMEERDNVRKTGNVNK